MSQERTSAIILAAGVARRLPPLTDHTQEELLASRQRVIVVVNGADQVRALAASAPSGMTIECVHNPAYQKGSSMSLYCARDIIRRQTTVIMDADVVFPREFLRRLVGATAEQAFLIDEGFTDTGEEVKIYVQNDRVIALGKKVV